MKQRANTKTFLDPAKVVAQTGLSKGKIAVDFGCGNGFYAVAAARRTGPEGQVHALDISESCLSQTSSLARLEGLYNISTVHGDLERPGGSGLNELSCDLVIIASLLHQVEDRDNILREAYRILKTKGELLVVEWKTEAPFGPSGERRVPQEETEALLQKFGFRPVKTLDAGVYHYALLYEK